jgi:hypothetical protein
MFVSVMHFASQFCCSASNIYNLKKKKRGEGKHRPTIFLYLCTCPSMLSLDQLFLGRFLVLTEIRGGRSSIEVYILGVPLFTADNYHCTVAACLSDTVPSGVRRITLTSQHIIMASLCKSEQLF